MENLRDKYAGWALVTGAAWHCYSLALWQYRRNELAQTIRWAGLSLLRNKESVPRLSCFRSLLVMSRSQQGETEEARKLLAEAATPSARSRKLRLKPPC